MLTCSIIWIKLLNLRFSNKLKCDSSCNKEAAGAACGRVTVDLQPFDMRWVYQFYVSCCILHMKVKISMNSKIYKKAKPKFYPHKIHRVLIPSFCTYDWYKEVEYTFYSCDLMTLQLYNWWPVQSYLMHNYMNPPQDLLLQILWKYFLYNFFSKI